MRRRIYWLLPDLASARRRPSGLNAMDAGFRASGLLGMVASFFQELVFQNW